MDVTQVAPARQAASTRPAAHVKFVTAAPAVNPINAKVVRDFSTGRWMPLSDLWKVTTIRFENGRTGYRVGPRGPIHASWENAQRHSANAFAKFSIRVENFAG